MRFSTTLCLALAGAFALAPARAHSPHDVVIELAVSPGFATDQTLFAAVVLTDNHVFALSNDAGRSWHIIGTPMAVMSPGNFVFSPGFVDDRTAFASTKDGAWRTLDGGLSWQLCSNGLPGAVRYIAISPNFVSDRTLIAATDGGVYRTSNAGNSWAPSNVGLTEAKMVRVGMAPDGQGGVTAFAVTTVLHVSADGGANWVAKGSFPKVVESLAISPNFASDNSVAVSFGRSGLGVALSQDGGQTFQFQNQGLSDLFVEEVALANDGTMFAATDTAGCFRADGPGQPWVLKTKGFEPPSDLTFVHNTEVVPSPDFANDGTVFEGAYEGLYRSYNRGDDWWQLNIYSQLLHRRFVFAPQFAADRQLLVGDYGGAVFRYTDPPALPATPGLGGVAAWGTATIGAYGTHSVGVASSPGSPPEPIAPSHTWEALGTAVSTPWAAVLAASPGPLGARTLIYGYTGLYQSNDEGSTWVSANKPFQISVVRAVGFSPAFAADQTVFIGSGMEGSYRTTNGCQKWQMLDGLPTQLQVRAVCVSPGWTQDQTVYFASRNFGIWRSTDGGWQWTHLQNGLATNDIKAFAMSPNFVVDRTLVAGAYDDGIWVSHDGGDSWAQEHSGLDGSFDHMVESVAFSPDYEHDGTLYVALQNEGVWRSTDFAESWEPTGTGLPGPPVELAVSPTFARDNTLVVGTFGGTMISRNRGQTWKPLPGYIRADDDHPAVGYSPGWTTLGATASFCSTVTQTAVVGDWCALEFYGHNITWYCDQKPDGSLVRITVDDGAPTLINTASPVPQPQQALFSKDFGTPGWHIVRIEHAGGGVGQRVLRSDGFAYEW